jgi:hypothetical protein
MTSGEYCMLLKELLQLIGFRVLDCIDGQNAIDVAERFEQRIDLIVTEVGCLVWGN